MREQPLGERLLQHDQLRGAAGELHAGAMLRRAGINFEWFPIEGGEFRVDADVVEYVEVKRPMYHSERTIAEMHRLYSVGHRLTAAVPGYEVEYSLRHDIADDLSGRARDRMWTLIADELESAARDLVVSGAVPSRRETSVGTIWIAHTKDELDSMRAGRMGLALDDRYEAKRVVRSAIDVAVRELPSRRRALIYLEWSGMGRAFPAAAAKRLASLRADQPHVLGVFVRGYTLEARQIVPNAWVNLIENPTRRGAVRDSAVVAAFSADHHAVLRP